MILETEKGGGESCQDSGITVLFLDSNCHTVMSHPRDLSLQNILYCSFDLESCDKEK